MYQLSDLVCRYRATQQYGEIAGLAFHKILFKISEHCDNGFVDKRPEPKNLELWTDDTAREHKAPNSDDKNASEPSSGQLVQGAAAVVVLADGGAEIAA